MLEHLFRKVHDDKALNLAFDLLRGAQSNPTFPPNPDAANLPR